MRVPPGTFLERNIILFRPLTVSSLHISNPSTVGLGSVHPTALVDIGPALTSDRYLSISVRA